MSWAELFKGDSENIEKTDISLLKTAMQEGLNSERVINFDPEKHLAELKAKKKLKK